MNNMEQFSLEKYLKNPNRKIVTRGGKSVRIVCADRKECEKKIIALVESDGKETDYLYFPNGRYCSSREDWLDLFFATEDEEKTDTPMATAKITQGGTSMKPFKLIEYLKKPQKKIITRDGRSARIICINRDGLNTKPIVALITLPNGDEVIKTYWEDGVETRGRKDNPYDLFFVTEKKTKWLNIYTDNDENPIAGCFFETEEEAVENKSTGYTYIDTVKIEVEE